MTHRTLRVLRTVERRADDIMSIVDLAMTCYHAVLQLILKEACPPISTIRDVFQQPVLEVLTEVCKLARMTREDVISKNYHVISFRADKEFIARQMFVEEGDTATCEDRVACTTRLGLIYTSKQVRTKMEECVVLKKAQIVTKAVICDMQESGDTSEEVAVKEEDFDDFFHRDSRDDCESRPS